MGILNILILRQLVLIENPDLIFVYFAVVFIIMHLNSHILNVLLTKGLFIKYNMYIK